MLSAAAWRRCRVHFTRNLQGRAPKDCEGLVSALPRQVFAQPGLAEAKAHWRRVADQIGPRFPKAAALMDGAKDGAPGENPLHQPAGRSTER